jgi:hypothetical protein
MGKNMEEKVQPIHRRSKSIRLEGNITGSLIWNAAWSNKNIIQQHCFWEVRNEGHTMFWDDAWQQLPAWRDREDLQQLREAMLNQGKKWIAQYWAEEFEDGQWRSWISKDNWLPLPNDMD